MPRDSGSTPRRRLVTPDRPAGTSRESTRRSRSPTRRGSRGYRSRSRLRSSERRQVPSRAISEKEQEIQRQREKLRMLEDALRRDHSLDMRYSRRERNEPSSAAERKDRSGSPSFTSKDIANIINSLSSLKPQPQPLTVASTSQSNNMNHRNILPDFDPSSKGQRIDIWIKKVNECATVYGWDDKTIIHFAMQKLQGLAKLWYESLTSILFTWAEWQEKLLLAFPFEQNYGQSLEDMLKRKSRFNEPLEVYYYEKLALLNQCDIEGKRAVDCIIHGLTDKTMRSSANALRCTNPDQLLHFLMSNKETLQHFDRYQSRNRPISDVTAANNNPNFRTVRNPNNPNNELYCYNCREKGHPFFKCSKPLVQCIKCRRFGHKAETCNTKQEINDKQMNIPKTMSIMASKPNAKFIKCVKVNDTPTLSFIDFGSEVSLMQQTLASSLGVICDRPPIPLKGFGNNVVSSIGGVKVNLCVDDVSADVLCHVVEDRFLDSSLLIGQSFTEQSHVLVLKNAEELKFFNTSDNTLLPCYDDLDEQSVIVITSADVKLYGAAVVKAYVRDISDGYILLNGKVIGRPDQELAVTGGMYQVRKGKVYIQVVPVLSSYQLYKGNVICRGARIEVVNRLYSSPDDSSASVECSAIDCSQVHISDSINNSEKQRLLNLLDKYRHCFAGSLKELGCTNMAEMRIELNSNRPVVYRPYRLSYNERERVREMVKEMIDAGIVRESVSEYASPIILVRKKDGKQRLCVDYRLLNSVTVKERYPMPVIEDEIARLSGQAFFITLDLASGYYQVPISEESKPLTSFVTPDGQYEFNRMPFGLANAPAVFQRLMNRVLGSARFSEATAYIDDVLIYGKSVEECLERLEKVLQQIEQAKLTLNLSKCNFLQRQINYLGYQISAAGVRPGDKKVQSVLNFPRPANQHSVRQFLGLVGYFRKFIKNFATLSHPLNKLLKKDVDWVWSDEQESAFVDLKNRLVVRPILAIYDSTAETELHTDASKVGVGGILMQRCHDGDSFRPVAYYSRQTSPEEKNFHAFELETLAVVCSLKKFRVYLLGQNFKIITDCSALRSTFSKRDLIPRIARWWLLLQEFNCSVEYRAGTKMSHVDALSRNPVMEEDNDSNVEQYPTIMVISKDDWIQTLQLGDVELSRIRDIVTSDIDAEGLKYVRDNYIVKDDKLYRCLDNDRTKLRWVVPKGARWQICRMNHDEIGHLGVEKTLERIRKTYWFSKMSRFVKKYVQACLECAYSKRTNNKEGFLHPIQKVEVPFHTLHIDHLGPFIRSKKGNSYLLVLVDAFTKFMIIRPVRNTKTLSTIKVLEDIFYIFRNPDRIISDRGTSFTSYAFKHFCSEKGIRHVLNAVASPRSNGQVERCNRTIISSLTAQNLNFDDKDWDNKVGRVQWGINNTPHKTTGRTPAEVMFGPKINSEINPKLNEIMQETRENTDLIDIRESVKDRIDEEQLKQKLNYDKNRRPARVYREGELIKISRTSFVNDGNSKKLVPPYIGPYRVVAVLGNDRYRVAAIPGLSSTKNKRKTTVASDRMLPWVHVAALNVNESNDDSDKEDSSTSDNDTS